VCGLAAAFEALDDNHAAAAARTWLRQRARLIGLGRFVILTLRDAGRLGEQLAGTCNVDDPRSRYLKLGSPAPRRLLSRSDLVLWHTSATLGHLRVESATWGQADIDQLTVTNRDITSLRRSS
jgi:hypothetical protein